MKKKSDYPATLFNGEVGGGFFFYVRKKKGLKNEGEEKVCKDFLIRLKKKKKKIKKSLYFLGLGWKKDLVLFSHTQFLAFIFSKRNKTSENGKKSFF